MAIALIILVVLVLAAVGVVQWLKTTRTTAYWFSDYGFRAFQFHDSPPHREASPEQVRKAIEVLLAGGPYDSLFIHTDPDPIADCVTLSLEEGKVELSLGFLAQKEQELLEQSLAALTAMGLERKDDHSWNEDLGPELECITVTYLLPADAETIHTAAEVAVTARFPTTDHRTPTPAPRYLSALNSETLPNNRRGLFLARYQDPLDGVI